jgi:CheY-like chemotaxis protein
MKKVLIVDDEANARNLLREILEPEGYQTLEAGNGQEALKLLESDPVDLIVSDRAMPGMGGLELLEALQKRGQSIPAIIVSAFGEESLWGQAISFGAVDYLVKPYKAAEVLRAVKKCLSGKKAP